MVKFFTAKGNQAVVCTHQKVVWRYTVSIVSLWYLSLAHRTVSVGMCLQVTVDTLVTCTVQTWQDYWVLKIIREKSCSVQWV